MVNLRLFTALRLPPETLESALVIQAQVANRLGDRDFRWVGRDNLHITVHFLGDTPATRVDEIVAAVQTVVMRPVPLILAAPGAFPGVNRPRTLWIGIEDTEGALSDLERACRQALLGCGCSLDSRRYTPHVTMGYVRRNASRAGLVRVAESFRSQKNERTRFTAGTLVLIKSDLGPGGARYTDLHEIDLSKE